MVVEVSILMIIFLGSKVVGLPLFQRAGRPAFSTQGRGSVQSIC